MSIAKKSLLMPNSQNSRLIALSTLAFVVFNFPLLDVFRKMRWFHGIPSTYLFLFIGWFVLILTARRIVEGKRLPFFKNKI
jgi:hypothetical protein